MKSQDVVRVVTLEAPDETLTLRPAGKTGHAVTAGDHTARVGQGGAVVELLGEALPMPLERLGGQGFGESGDSTGPHARPASTLGGPP